jgi:hypothetical protein
VITFKQFLSESRSSKISADKAISWMEDNAKDYLSGEIFLYRGIKNRDPDITFANTQEGEPRKSIGNMANFYTLWMSYNPEWKDKPRRERSFICSSSPEDASTWGSLHLLVPSNDSKIGYTKADDIWNIQLGDDKDYLSVAAFTSSTRRFLAVFDLPEAQTYEQLAHNLKQITVEAIEAKNKEKVEAGHNYWHGEERLLRYMDKRNSNNLFDLWSKVFDPSNFKFMTSKDISGEGEFWVDGKAIYIPLSKKPRNYKGLITWAEEKAPKLERILKGYWKDL